MNTSRLICAFTILLLISIFQVNSIAQNCNPDLLGPITNCNATLTIEFVSGQAVTIDPADMLEAASDNCTAFEDLDFYIDFGNSSPSLPSTTSITFPVDTTGIFPVSVWAVDEADNVGNCWGNVVINDISAGNCDPDETAPVAVCNPDMTVYITSGGTITIPATDFDDGSFDNCTASEDLSFFITDDLLTTVIPTTTEIELSPTPTGEITLAMWVQDESGLFNFCLTTVVINLINENCNPDETAPIAVCESKTVLNIAPGGSITIPATNFDDGSYDNCSELDFFVTADIDATVIPTATEIVFTESTNDTVIVALWMVDEAENYNLCLTTVVINPIDDNCNPDLSGPIAACNAITAVTSVPNEDIIILPSDIDAGSSDNCTAPEDLAFFIEFGQGGITPPMTTSLTLPAGTTGTYPVTVWVFDEADFSSICWGNIVIDGGGNNCSPDETAPVAICDNFLSISLSPFGDFDLTGELLDDGSYDNCTAQEDLELFVTLDPTLTAPPSTTLITFPGGTNDTFTVVTWVVDEAGFFSNCATEVTAKTAQLFTGTVFFDDNNNCNYDLDENNNGIGNFTVRYTLDEGMTYTNITTNAEGLYQFDVSSGLNTTATALTVEVLLPQGLSSNCPTTTTVDFPLDPNPGTYNFPIQLASDCENMTVDISTPFLRRCFPVDYTATFCNASINDIDSVEMTVTFPPEMVVLNSTIPYTDLGNNQLLFELGTVEAGFCGQIPITVVLDCTTPLGATKCVQAAIIPNDCSAADANWSGASLVASAECNESSGKVELSITNVGSAPMAELRDFLIVEDVIMYIQEPIQLDPNESKTIEMDANGATWRIEMLQEIGHPSISTPSAVVEGCGGFGSMGFINQFGLGDDDPYLAIDCQEVIGSYDPNEKRAYPTGYGEDNTILANTSIEYHLHFQNTGTDTAFTVRLEDQLSEHLDFTSIQAGAASHPYRMELQEDGLLIFHFENILLPDSTVNEPGSHGFVQFRVNQRPDLAVGTIIENTVDIYFDFNEAIVTNTVFHTIGTNEVTTSTQMIETEVALTIAPNPFTEKTLFTLNGLDQPNTQFELYDVLGQLVKSANFTGSTYELSGKSLSKGAYFYRFSQENRPIASGKVMLF